MASTKKPTANIILNSERQNAFPLGSGTGKGYLLPIIFTQHNTILASAVRQEK